MDEMDEMDGRPVVRGCLPWVEYVNGPCNRIRRPSFERGWASPDAVAQCQYPEAQHGPSVHRYREAEGVGGVGSAVQVKDGFVRYWGGKRTFCLPFYRRTGSHSAGHRVAPFHRELPFGGGEVHGHLVPFGQVSQVSPTGCCLGLVFS